MTELANSKINHLKVINNWRQFMRSSKLESLKRDLEVLAQDHEREVDRQDAIVNMLMRSHEEADEQVQTAQRAHMHQIERLTEFADLELTYSIGGQISFDVFPTGWDKVCVCV